MSQAYDRTEATAGCVTGGPNIFTLEKMKVQTETCFELARQTRFITIHQ